VTARTIVLGVRCRETPTGVEQFCLYRLRYDGTSIALDPSFAGDGQLVLRSADPTLPLRYWSHAVDGQGRVLVAYGQGRTGSLFTPVVLRLRADGSVDTSFQTGGVAQIPVTGATSNPRTVTVDINGNIQVSGETFTPTSVRPFMYFLNRTSAPGAAETYTPQLFEYALANYPNSTFFSHERDPDGTLTAVGAAFLNYPDTASMRPLIVQLVGPPAGQPAIEYFNAGFGHYISVVNPEEIRKLDTGEFVGWARTGYFFYVYPIGTPGTFPIDRFFTTAFPPKSSHVFSANAAESAAIRQNPVWQFEGTVFGALLPTADGRCPLWTRIVSRVYNNGSTGAPNHRFADDGDVIGTARAAGGVLEGAGPLGAFYCTE
jgi:hypothetical protein